MNKENQNTNNSKSGYTILSIQRITVTQDNKQAQHIKLNFGGDK